MKKSDVIIIGGGLAGLTAAIYLSRCGLEVKLFEKSKFPRHKVCGEYVSQEIEPFLHSLDLSLSTLNPAYINRLLYSTSRGNSVEISLPLGGLGISRFALDNYLYQKAKENGVEVIQTTVTSVEFTNKVFKVTTSDNKSYKGEIALGAFGKRSNLDKDLERSFFNKQAPWLAVKAHYSSPDFPEDVVELHNFRGGYCGISKVETGDVNVCYLATYKSFKKHKNPADFKNGELRQNPLLNSFFDGATPVFDKPLTIAQISFSPKDTVKDHVLMLGDAAGLLHPLCGNGMAMAIHSAKIASDCVMKYFRESSFDRDQMETEYSFRWKSEFKTRLNTGKYLQKILLNPRLAELSQSVVSGFPSLLSQIIKRTHGKPFI